MFARISIAALFAGLAAARTTYTTQNGNPITRPLNEIVPACAPFNIQWTPTNSQHSVSLILLKGPSNNVIPQYPIVEGIPPSGSYSWTPKSDLEATTTPTGYGIMIIDDVTGEFQYSTQFGISKSGCVASSSSSPVATVQSSSSSSAAYAAIPTSIPVETKTPVVSKSSYAAIPSASSTFKTYVPVASTTGAPANGTIVYPTKSMTVPASLRPTATGNSTAPQFTGAASALQAGMSLAGFAAAVVAML